MKRIYKQYNLEQEHIYRPKEFMSRYPDIFDKLIVYCFKHFSNFYETLDNLRDNRYEPLFIVFINKITIYKTCFRVNGFIIFERIHPDGTKKYKLRPRRDFFLSIKKKKNSMKLLDEILIKEVCNRFE